MTTTILATTLHTSIAAAASPGQGGTSQQAPSPQRAPGDGEAPPPARELTPAEIGALQTMMTNRAIGSQLTPANAEALRRMMMETQGMTPPVGTADAIKPHPRRIDVDPQVLLEQPESLRLALGVVTPITFLDSSGRPWPVEAVAFDPRMLAQDGNGCGSSAPPNSAVQGAGERPSTITMMPCRINTFGNVSIKLEGYALPVILMAKSTGTSGEVDLPVTVYVRGRSPASQPMPAEAMAAYTPPPATTRVSTGGGGRGRKGRGGDRGPMLPDRYLDTFGAGAPPANEFLNTTIILTANAGSEKLAALAVDPETMPEGEALVEALMPELEKHFKPAFLGRVTIVPYLPLSQEALHGIAKLQIGRIAERLAASHGARLEVDTAVEAAIVARCIAGPIGARAIEGVLSREILPMVSDLILDRSLDGAPIDVVRVALDANRRFTVAAGTAGAGAPAAPSFEQPAERPADCGRESDQHADQVDLAQA